MSNLVFFVGTGRCGSTLAYEIFCKHPDVGFVSNLDDRLAHMDRLGRQNNALYRLAPSTFDLHKHLGPSEGYRLLNEQVSPMFAQTNKDITADDLTPYVRQRLKRFFERRIDAQGRKVFAHKFTGWPRARLLHDALPEARFIHVVRDGRAVANSLLQMPWWLGYAGPTAWRYGEMPDQYAHEWRESGESSVLLAGITWKILIDEFRHARESLPPASWLEVRYEDLIADPRSTLGSFLDHSGISWNASFEKSVAGQRFATDPSSSFRRDLTTSQIASLEASLAGHLAEYGYDVGANDTVAG